MITIDANGAQLTPALARILLNRVAVKLNDAYWNRDYYHFSMNLAQRAAWENCGIIISGITPEVSSIKTMGGVPIKLDLNMSSDRIELYSIQGDLVVEMINLAVPNGYEVVNG